MYSYPEYTCLRDLITDMETVEMPYKEVSDIGDYEYIEENIYDIPVDIIVKGLGSPPNFCLGNYHTVNDCDTDSTCRCGEVTT